MTETPAVAKQAKPVAVLYGASTQQMRAISERIAEGLLASGLPAENRDLQGLRGFDLDGCLGAVLVAPVQQGKHDQAMVDFVKTHRAALDRLPVAFISATIEAGAQPPDAPETRGQFEGDVQMAPNPFFAETGWHPKRVKSFAGAISYTRYNFFVRAVMKLLAGKGAKGSGAGGARQKSGWDALDVFVHEFAREIRAAATQPAGQ